VAESRREQIVAPLTEVPDTEPRSKTRRMPAAENEGHVSLFDGNLQSVVI
jgi:hypothetical protein